MQLVRLFNSIKGLSRRHEKSVAYSLLYELFVRLYGFKYFRSIIKLIIRIKAPKRIDFVVGCYNSGTTIIKRVIGAHPDICISPVESDHLTNTISNIEYDMGPRAMVVNPYTVNNEHYIGTINRERYISDLRPWLMNGKIFLDKSISNTVRIDRLRRTFPGAKFVCVTRNVDGVVRGINKRSHPSGILRNILGKFEYPICLLQRQWIMFYSFVLDDYNKNSDDIYFVSYEKFLSSPVSQSKDIFSFIGLKPVELSYEDNILNVANKSLNIRQSKIEGVRYLCTRDDLVAEISKVKSRL